MKALAGLLDQDADRSDVLADRKTRKMESAAERLVSVAAPLPSKAPQSIVIPANSFEQGRLP